MQLDIVTLSGFRGHGNSISIPITPETTTLIGRNDAGKSSIFEALEIFFGGAKLEMTDFSVGVDQPVEISCTFSALPEAVVLDEKRSTSLGAEYLLDANGKLTLVKSWSRSKLTSPSMFAAAKHPVFQDETDLLSLKLPALKKKAETLGIPESDVDDRRTSSAYRQAIWQASIASGDAVLEDILVPLSSEDGKSVATALAGYLPHFHLFRADRPGAETDPLAQDPAKAAIKAVLDEHEEQLEELSKTVQRQVGELLGDVVSRLSEVAPDLAASLSPTDPVPTWSKAFSGLQFVDENGVPLSKRGSGTRRLVLLSFFRATAERGLEANDRVEEYRRGVITAVEEPETALHADLQTDIVSALQDVGELPHRQVLLTTHSANLIRLVPAASIRYIKGNRLNRQCVQVTPDGDSSDLLSELNRSLGVFTDHNVRCFLLVEGRNDVAGLKSLSQALELAGVDGVRALSELEAEGRVCFMPIGGAGSASLWNSNLSPFKRHEVHIMDSDKESAAHPLKQDMLNLLSRADDKRHVFILDRRELENYLTPDAVMHIYSDIDGFEASFNSISSNLGDWEYLDIPSLCAEAVHSSASPDQKAWDDVPLDSRKSKESRAKKRLARAFAHPSVSQALAANVDDALVALRTVTDLARVNN
ncbi:ATP-dependent nuclease [Arthrobacter sp. 131MFCol6.1]|uniref:ATP-dependent nuclease n=1 Tax=Arthrobacter sp. 131MFCol6.1 TaxID=1157944 RepID=UPI0018CB8270|nr:ATP-binding protein [Arthrobacter sp. 131MFCol6.1]